MDLGIASRKLSELDLKMTVDNLMIDTLWFRVAEYEGDWCINTHMHSTYEFHFICAGCSKVVLENGSFIAGAGEFYLTAPGVYHQQIGIGTEKCVEYCINCDIQLIDDRFSEARHMLEIFKKTHCKNMKDSLGAMGFFEAALHEAYYQNVGFYNKIKGLATMIIITVARMLSEDSPAEYNIPMKNKEDDYRLGQIEKFIEDNIFNTITTGDVAKYMYLSEKQVCRIIERAKGISTKGLMIHKKHQKAKELLKDSNLSIKEISEMLGYSSEYYFNQFFKTQEGYPPGVYRKNIK
ncbi:MAG: AraC family transcriptional regulator [Firmicutes bacterium]|nr:AraC family transcriptional regulator [Bacillota bacterium]